MRMQLAQRQHREPDRPETETPNALLAFRNHARVLERVTQMRVRDADQPLEPFAKRVALVQILEPREIEVLREDRARQPARVRLTIVPDVFQDVRHLQSLAERHRELSIFSRCGASSGQCRQNSSVHISPTTPAT